MADGSQYAGLGHAFSFHDLVVCEGQGPIYDRTGENLRREDLAIGMLRRVLLRAIRTKEEGGDPPHVARATGTNSFPELVVVSEIVPGDTDLVAHVHKSVESRRATTGTLEPAA